MLKWLLVMVAVTILLGVFAPILSKLGLWRLPGDLRFKRHGRDYFLPMTSTILIALLLTLLFRIFKI